MSVMCAHCHHLPHPDRRCRAVRVDGPPSDQGRKVGDSYEHTGRTETPCTCEQYTAELNGAEK